MTVDWGAPNLMNADGDSAMIDTVASTPWSIGRATYSSVQAAGDPNAHCVAWRVEGGNFITLAFAMQYPDSEPRLVPLTSYVWIPKLNELSCLSGIG